MISLILFLFTIALAIGILISTRDNATIKVPSGYRNDPDKTVLNFKWLIKPIIIVIIGFTIMLFQPYTLERVLAGNVGVKANLSGDERGISKYEYKMGWTVFNNWSEDLYQYPVFQQHVEYDTLEVITKGGFPAKIKPTFNYSLIAGNVGDMFQNLRKPIEEIEQGWLKTGILSSVNDVANEWTVDSIFNHRQQFEGAIIIECNKRVSAWFSVSQLRSNITPPPSLQQAIVDKTNNIQLTQAKDQEADLAKAQAGVKIATARGDSAQAVISAKGRANALIIEATAEALAMKKKKEELTPVYNDYIRASNWDGKLSTYSMGSGGTTLFNIK